MTEHTCTPCPICKGSGTVYEDGWGQQHSEMWEDTDSPESCDYCEGSGRVGRCDRCTELELEENQ